MVRIWSKKAKGSWFFLKNWRPLKLSEAQSHVRCPDYSIVAPEILTAG